MPTNETDIAIQTNSLTRSFGDTIAVNKIDLSVHYQSIFGLLGPNGAGKTTFIKMLTTLLKPTNGTANICGYDIVKQAELVRAQIGYVPQLISADGNLTAYENMLLLARLYGVPRKEQKSRIKDILNLMDLISVSNELVKTFSGGMIRKLEIGLSLLHQPGVLILDEPTIGLDPIARHTLWDRLLSLKKQFKLAVLITTHDMEEADYLCDYIAIIQKGNIIIQGQTSDLKKSVSEKANLNDVFTYYCKGSIEAGGTYKNAKDVRKHIKRLG